MLSRVKIIVNVERVGGGNVGRVDQERAPYAQHCRENGKKKKEGGKWKDESLRIDAD